MRSNLHVGLPSLGMPVDARQRSRWRLRRVAAALAFANAVVYALIGAGVARVVEDGGSAGVSLAVFGATAAAAFLLGAVLLVVIDNRLVWLVGAVFQVFTIVAYLNVAPQRAPAYEPWGISLKIAQAALLALLAYLALTPARSVARQRAW